MTGMMTKATKRCIFLGIDKGAFSGLGSVRTMSTP